MKLPLSWIREMVDVPLAPGELAHSLTMAGTEVEAWRRIGADWEGVVVAQVVDVARVPGADTLLVTQVDDGSRRATVVTGAPNLAPGDRVPWVRPGGVLPGNFQISRRTFRGVESAGMLCAADELDLGIDHDGIYILPPDAPLGANLADYLDEVIFDFKITPNRPDTMNVLGIAREISAVLELPLRPPLAAPAGDGPPIATLLEVAIQDPELCPRYSASMVLGTQVGDSPPWMQRRLYLSGVRPISNVVDVTNYVMLELGQPLHAFDFGRLHGTVVARRARAGETLTTLDGQERALPPDALVIADDREAHGVAGVMGGLSSEVNEQTRDVVIEAANFERTGIRRTSKALRLSTEASKRFERGLDPEMTAAAAARAAALIAELGGGSVARGVADAYPAPRSPRRVSTTTGRLAALLGRKYSAVEIEGVLGRLGFDVHVDGEAISALVPGWRQDVEGPADLAEEVARISGYEEIENTLPAGRLPDPYPDETRRWGLKARRALVAAGLQEVITYSLVDPRQADLLYAHPGADGEHAAVRPIRIANPLSSEHAALRTTLLGSLLETVEVNLRHSPRVHVFELARVYLPPLDPLPTEVRRLALAMTGLRQTQSWGTATPSVDFYDIKGAVDSVHLALGLRTAEWSPTSHPSLHPGQAATISVSGQAIGHAGQLHPAVADRFGLEDHPIFVAELDFEALVRLAVTAPPIAAPPRLPGVEMDVAAIVAEDTPHDQIEAVIREFGAPLLEGVSLFDVYRGQPVPNGKKSVAFSLTYRAPDRTLTDREASEAHARVEGALSARFGAQIRGR